MKVVKNVDEAKPEEVIKELSQSDFEGLWKSYHNQVVSSIQRTEANAQAAGQDTPLGYKSYMTGLLFGGLTFAKSIGQQAGLDTDELVDLLKTLEKNTTRANDESSEGDSEEETPTEVPSARNREEFERQWEGDPEEQSDSPTDGVVVSG